MKLVIFFLMFPWYITAQVDINKIEQTSFFVLNCITKNDYYSIDTCLSNSCDTSIRTKILLDCKKNKDQINYYRTNFSTSLLTVEQNDSTFIVRIRFYDKISRREFYKIDCYYRNNEENIKDIKIEKMKKLELDYSPPPLPPPGNKK